MSPPHCMLLSDSIPTGFGEDEPVEESGEESKTAPEAEELPEFETMSDNYFSIRLSDSDGAPHYLSQVSPDLLRLRLPISVILNTSDGRLRGDCPRFNYLDLEKTSSREATDPPELRTYPPGCLASHSSQAENAMKLKYCVDSVDPADHSHVKIRLLPYLDGEFYLHVLLGNEELLQSPLKVRIVKSEEQRRMEALEKMEQDRLERLREERRRERQRKLDQVLKKKKLAEEDKLR